MSFFDFVLFIAALAVAWLGGTMSVLWVLKRKAPNLYQAVVKAISSKGDG